MLLLTDNGILQPALLDKSYNRSVSSFKTPPKTPLSSISSSSSSAPSPQPCSSHQDTSDNNNSHQDISSVHDKINHTCNDKNSISDTRVILDKSYEKSFIPFSSSSSISSSSLQLLQSTSHQNSSNGVGDGKSHQETSSSDISVSHVSVSADNNSSSVLDSRDNDNTDHMGRHKVDKIYHVDVSQDRRTARFHPDFNLEYVLASIREPLQYEEKIRTSPARACCVINNPDNPNSPNSPLSSGARWRLEITIFEGKNRQIRRLCARAGLKVLQLTRISFGNLSITGLAPGEWRSWSQEEVTQCYAHVMSSRVSHVDVPTVLPLPRAT